MDRKQSQFNQVSELESSDFLPAFGGSTNKKISKADLFDQIKDETGIFIYPTIEQLQSANLSSDPDFPIYVRVEETEYRLYKITSLAAGVGDISLNNGATATVQAEYSEIGFVVGPSPSTDNAIALFDGEMGTQLKNGPVLSSIGEAIIGAPEVSDTSYIRVNADETITLRNTSQHKSDLSLNNVENTSDEQKVSSGPIFDALLLKAPLASPVFTGNPTAPTPPLNDNDTSIATTAFAHAVKNSLFVETYGNISSTPLAIGQTVFLKQHTSAGVGGGEFIGVSAAGLTVDTGSVSSTATPGVYAKRVFKGYYSPEMFGALNATNSTLQINNAITAINLVGGGVVKCESQIYSIDGNANPSVFIYGGVKMKQNVHLDMNGATFALIPNANANYCIINCYQITDFKISNGKLLGDIATHLGATGEFGHGLFLAESKRFVIDNIQSDDNWGDGFYISEENASDNLKAEDGYLYNIRANRNRRQAMSVTGARNIHVVDFKFTNTATLNGTAPGAGIDIEPLASGVPCEDISFANGFISGNSLGIVLDAVHAGNIKNISFKNITIKSSAQSGVFSNRSPDNIIGVRFESCLIENGIYGGVGCTFDNCITTRASGSTSIYAIELTNFTKNLRYRGGEIRSIGSGFKLAFIPGTITFQDRPIFDKTRFVLESGANGPNTVIITFGPCDFINAKFGTEGTVPTGNFGFDFSNNRLGRNFGWLHNCTIDPTWHSGLGELAGTYSMNDAKEFGEVNSGTRTPNAAICDIYTVTHTTGTVMTLAAPQNAYKKFLTIRIVNASGGVMGTITWNSVYKMSAWTNPANGFSRSITFKYDGTNWIEVSRTPADVPN